MTSFAVALSCALALNVGAQQYLGEDGRGQAYAQATPGPPFADYYVPDEFYTTYQERQPYTTVHTKGDYVEIVVRIPMRDFYRRGGDIAELFAPGPAPAGAVETSTPAPDFERPLVTATNIGTGERREFTTTTAAPRPKPTPARKAKGRTTTPRAPATEATTPAPPPPETAAPPQQEVPQFLCEGGPCRPRLLPEQRLLISQLGFPEADYELFDGALLRPQVFRRSPQVSSSTFSRAPSVTFSSYVRHR